MLGSLEVEKEMENCSQSVKETIFQIEEKNLKNN